MFWLYRCGFWLFDNNRRRSFSSETWLSETAEVSISQTVTAITPVAVRLMTFWTGGAGRPIYTGAGRVERLWPYPQWGQSSPVGPVFSSSTLNINAPEAAFRLQRVGESGAIGRLTLPILTDSKFTDLPHRRHIDMDDMVPRVREVDSSWPNEFTSFGRTYKNVVFSRRTHTWQLVTSYRLLVNPVRLWQRWRPVATPPHINSSFIPDEVEHFG